MKKLRQYIIVTAVFIALISCGYTVNAAPDLSDTQQYNGYYYKMLHDYVSGTHVAFLTGMYIKPSTDTLTLPEYIGINNYPVAGLILGFSQEGLRDVKTLNIPASVLGYLNVEYYNADKFDNLTNINIIGESPNYVTQDGILYNKDMTELVYFPRGKTGTYILPDGVTSINVAQTPGDMTSSKRNVLSGSKINELILNDDIVSVNRKLYLNNLESIYLGNNLEFSNSLFIYLNNLVNVKVGNDNPSYTSIDGILYSKDGLRLKYFPQGRTGSYRIRKGTEVIDDNALQCSNLSVVYLPNSVNTINSNIFRDPTRQITSKETKIKDIYIPSSVRYIAADAFVVDIVFGDKANVTIHSPKGSYAHEYATKNNINWVEAEPIVTAEYTDGKVIADVEYLPIRTDLEHLPGEPPIIDSQKLYIAVYNTRNQLVKYFTQFVSDGEYSFDVSNIPDAFRVKAMLWDDADTFTPLCPAATAYVN